MQGLLNNFDEAAAVILFCIGFSTLLFHRNMLKKIIGLNIMDTGLYLFLASMGYIRGAGAPILTDTEVINMADYINPVPSALVLTGIVVSVSVTAITLSLTVRLYSKYRTLNLDEIYAIARRTEKEEF
ncbi:MAG: cation:proton antiporter subunit C [Oscillospiraceae bacterium]|nr:cation:proton antiporter subunit C [Oscillospiraceae bacterium]